jgi:hypothetical protein
MSNEIQVSQVLDKRGVVARLVEVIRALFQRIAAWVAATRDRMRRVRELESFARTVLAEGVLDDDGLTELLARQHALELKNEDLGLLPRRMVDMVVRQPLRTNRMSPAQDASLDRIVQQFGGSESRVRTLRKRLTQARLLYDIDAGELPTVTVCGLILQGGERAHWAEPGVILEERVVSRRYEGGSTGVSFRIAKGVTYRVGAHRGHLVSRRAMVPVSEGVFVMTNKRVLFNGSGKSLAAKWERVLSLNVLEDGCMLTLENRTQSTIIQFHSRQNTAVVAAVASRLSQRASDEV